MAMEHKYRGTCHQNGANHLRIVPDLTTTTRDRGDTRKSDVCHPGSAGAR